MPRASEDTYGRLNESGQIEIIDAKTGQVIHVEKKKTHSKDGKRLHQHLHKKHKKGETHVILDGNGDQQVVPVGTNPEDLSRDIWPYNSITANHILQKVMEGMSLTKIGKLTGFPPTHIIYAWVRKYPDFKTEWKQAKAARAEWAHDKVMEAAEEVDEHNYQSKRTQIDAYKWMAKVNDPEVFGDRTKVVGDPDAPVGFIIDTGIRRENDKEALDGNG